jgi:glycosyltransferase involved in cell wall biosynthesis
MIISIITVVYNGKTSIETLLLSIRDLKSLINCEFIVIDGMSTDGTYDLLKQNNDIIDVLITERDRGIYDAMNKGLQYASGDFCIFMGSDDEVISKNFKEFVGYIKKDDRIYHGSVYKSGYLLGRRTNFWRILRENIPHQATFYPKILYKSQNYNLVYPICADHEYNILAYYKKFKFTFIQLAVAKFGDEGCSSKSKDVNFERDYFRIVRENAGFIIFLIISCGKKVKKILAHRS